MEIEDKAEKTIEGYKQAFKTLSEVYSGGYSIHKVNRTAIWQIKAYLKNKGNRPATINSYLKRLRAAFKRLYLDDVIDKNPFQEFEPLYKPKDKQNIYTFDELKRLLQILNSDKNRKLCRLMRISLFTGIRRGEVLNIERIDVNLGERFYRAINNKSKDKHKVWREIPNQVFDDFKYFMDLNPLLPYPFKVYKPNLYTCMTKKLLKRHRFHPDLHLHSFRHTAITRAIESGMDIREVQKIIDHSRITVTELYAHDKPKRALDIGLE